MFCGDFGDDTTDEEGTDCCGLLRRSLVVEVGGDGKVYAYDDVF